MKTPASAALALLSLWVLGACETLPPLAPGDPGTRGPLVPIRTQDRGPRLAGPEVALEPADEARLAGLKETVAEALFDAFSRGEVDGQALATSRDVLTASPLPLGELVGTYRCRTLKHGGPVPFITYRYFRCEVGNGPAGLTFEKPEGSQRMAGRLFLAPRYGADGDTALAYAGTQYHSGEAPLAYPNGASEVGFFERTGEDRYRLMLPRPGEEGLLDVIDLTRVEG